MTPIFVEVGSCDFDNLDALLLDGWTGYFIEPVPEYLFSLMNKIRNNCGDKPVNAFFENLAISDHNGTGQIRYYPPLDNLPWWSKGVGHIMNGSDNNAIEHNPNLTNYRQELKVVDTVLMTLDSFLDKHKITNIEIMKIDVEGHELDILRNYSWKVKPRHLKIEHTHAGLDALLQILRNQGYTYRFDSEDIFAFKGD